MNIQEKKSNNTSVLIQNTGVIVKKEMNDKKVKKNSGFLDLNTITKDVQKNQNELQKVQETLMSCRKENAEKMDKFMN